MHGWRAFSVALANAFIVDEHNRDSLDVQWLQDLPAALRRPPKQWPHADLRMSQRDLRIEPATAKPGEHAIVTVTVRNVGADLARVRVSVSGSAPCSDIGQWLGDLSGKIPPGQTWTSRAQIIVPAVGNTWLLSASVELMPVTQFIGKQDVGRTGRWDDVGLEAHGPGPRRECRGFP